MSTSSNAGGSAFSVSQMQTIQQLLLDNQMATMKNIENLLLTQAETITNDVVRNLRTAEGPIGNTGVIMRTPEVRSQNFTLDMFEYKLKSVLEEEFFDKIIEKHHAYDLNTYR